MPSTTLYVVVAPLGGLPARFGRDEWPLHLTLVSNFTLMHAIGDLKRVVKVVADSGRPVSVRGGAEAMFGPHANIPVRLVESDDAVSIHQKLLTALDGLIDLVEPDYAGNGFRPHVTARGADQLGSGESRTLDSLSLVAMTMDAAKVVATYQLMFAN